LVVEKEKEELEESCGLKRRETIGLMV